MKSHRTRFHCSLLVLFTTTACGVPYHLPERAQQTIAVDVPIPEPTRRLEVQFHDGLLTLATGPTLSCTVQIHLVADDDKALEELAASVHPQTLAVEPGTTRLQVALPPGGALDSVRTTWHITAPANTTVVATTRRGAVVARDAAFDLEVRGGSGVVEAQMAGGAARLSTSSGSLILRGDYPYADLQSDLGRIDLCLPAVERREVEARIVSHNGDVYVDLRKRQLLDFLYFGEERLVHCDPEVRVAWERNRPVDGVDYLEGRLGDLQGERSGQLRLDSQAPVHVRLRPDGAVAGSR